MLAGFHLRKSYYCVMLFSYAYIIVLLSTFCFSVLGQVPIPKRPLGFVYDHGNAAAPVLLDVYIGPVCPASKMIFPTLLQVADNYGPDIVKLTLHLFPLPYHRASFLVAKGTHIVHSATGGKNTYAWVASVYKNLPSLSNEATYNMSEQQVTMKLSGFAESLGVKADYFIKMMDDDDIEMDTRLGWKYTCTHRIPGPMLASSLGINYFTKIKQKSFAFPTTGMEYIRDEGKGGIAWAPACMVNDVMVNADLNWTVDDWKKIIDPLLSKQTANLTHQAFVRNCKPGQKVCNYLPGKSECCKPGESCIPNVGCRC